MSDIFFGNLQLNTGNLYCNVPAVEPKVSLINASYDIPNKWRGVNFNTSVNAEKYTFEFVIWGRGDVWGELKQKELDIYNTIRAYTEAKSPILIRSETDDLIYLNYTAVYILPDSISFPTKGTDGVSMLSMKLECTVIGAPASLGGEVTLEEYYQVISL